MGYLPRRILGGELALDVDGASKAIDSVAQALALSTVAAAEGIFRIVNENMLGALRVVSSQRGHDPRRMALIAFGGAGPMHAVAMAEILGTWPVIIPPNPGVLCALGAAIAEYRAEFMQAVVRRIDDLADGALRDALAELQTRADSWLSELNLTEAATIAHEIDMKYHRQGFELTVSLTKDEIATVQAGGLPELRESFENIHKRLYGFVLDSTLEIVNVRLVVMAGTPAAVNLANLRSSSEVSESPNPRYEQPMYWNGRWQTAQVYDRSGLGPSQSISGPALIVEPTATTVLPPSHRLTVHSNGSLMIYPEDYRHDS